MKPYPYDSQIHPLVSWGGFRGKRRASDSPYVESVWEGTAQRNGTHQTAADGTIDLTFQKRQDILRLLLSGPTSKFRITTFEAGDEVLTVRLRTGVHIPTLAGTSLTDVDAFLQNASKTRFWLQDTALAFPTFDNIETFVEHIARLGLLQRNIIVEDVLSEKIQHSIHPRTIQRHFLATTGLTMNHIRQIRRAEQARSLLGNGLTLTSIAYDVGYSNPGHMTNAFNYFFGRTPSEMRALMTS